jgi:hypothetical protein
MEIKRIEFLIDRKCCLNAQKNIKNTNRLLKAIQMLELCIK